MKKKKNAKTEIKIQIKSVYTLKTIEDKTFDRYSDAEEYVFSTYKAVYEIKREIDLITFYVYQD